MQTNHIPDVHSKSLAQSSRPWTSGTTKLEPRSIRHLHDLPPDKSSFRAQECLGDSLSALSEPSQRNLQLLDLWNKTLILYTSKHVTCQLERRVVVLPLRLFEAKVSTRHRHDDIAVWLCQGDMAVVLRREYMKVVRLFVALGTLITERTQ